MAGIDSVEHATLLDEEGAKMMAEMQTYMVPTLSAVENIVKKDMVGVIPEYAVKKVERFIKDIMKVLSWLWFMIFHWQWGQIQVRH